jgi:hypothetical protein
MQGVDWAWLQPYIVDEALNAAADDTSVTEASDTARQEQGTTAFKPLAADQVEAELRFETGPYTAMEGYLQMRRGIVQESN